MRRAATRPKRPAITGVLCSHPMHHRSAGGAHCSCSPATTWRSSRHASYSPHSTRPPFKTRAGDGGEQRNVRPLSQRRRMVRPPSMHDAALDRFGRGERRCREPAAGDTLPAWVVVSARIGRREEEASLAWPASARQEDRMISGGDDGAIKPLCVLIPVSPPRPACQLRAMGGSVT